MQQDYDAAISQLEAALPKKPIVTYEERRAQIYRTGLGCAPPSSMELPQRILVNTRHDLHQLMEILGILDVRQRHILHV